MLNFSRGALGIGFLLLIINVISILALEKVEVASSILGGLLFTIGLLIRFAYVFSNEDQT